MKKNWEGGNASAPDLNIDQIDAWLHTGNSLQVQPYLAALLGSVDVSARIRAARALRALGAERSGDALMLRLARQHPDHPESVLGLLRTQLCNRGAFVYWQSLLRWPLPPDSSTHIRAWALSVRGMAMADLRDFEGSQQLHADALALMPDDTWLQLERNYSWLRQDRFSEALESAQGVLAREPDNRAAVEQAARVLLDLRCREEAEAMLRGALARNESASGAWLLHGLLAENEQYEEALLWLNEIERRQPLADRWVKGALAVRRCDALLQLGRDDEARTQALQVASLPGYGYYARLAERLVQPLPGRRRVLLKLEYVRQHQMTCAPATLATLCRFWSLNAEHLEIAQAICYDGTMDVSERRWAEQQGLVVREFTLTWDSACELLDAGLPFALTTQQTASGHLQAVVGYDRQRHSLLVRDPMMPLHAEFDAEALFNGQQSGGPRAMLLLPADSVQRLVGLVLPEVEAWDALHAVAAPLERHLREPAQMALEAMRKHHAGSWLLTRAERTLAAYDGNELGILIATEAQLERFPKDINLQLSRLSSLLEIRGQAAGEAYLSQLVEQPNPDPLLLMRWSERLALDGRRLPEAFAVLRRALRRTPSQGRLWGQWAALEWQAGRWAQSLEPYRWAATLQPVDEWAAQAYARACRFGGAIEDGVRHLRRREAHWGDRSGSPAITLVDWLESLDRRDEAESALEAARLRRPDDPALKLHAVERHLNQRHLEEAIALLATVREPHRPAPALRLRALLHEVRNDIAAALVPAYETIQAEPFSLQYHRLLLRLLARHEGHEAALTTWSALVAPYPAHYGLQRLRYEWLGENLAAQDAQLALLQQHHPGDPWLQRELSILALRKGQLNEAVRQAEMALALAPMRADSHGVLAACQLRRDGYTAALVSLQAAVRLDVDYTSVLTSIICDAPDSDAARAAVALAADELRRQVLSGDSLLVFQVEAHRGWPADEVLAVLRQLNDQHADLWQSWAVLARQLRMMGQDDEAFSLLARACERFAHLPRLHWEHADALRSAGRRGEALQANARALQINPGWNNAVRLQVDLIQQTTQDWGAAEALLNRALLHAWDDDDLMGLLAWVHERQGGEVGTRDTDVWVQARRSLLRNPRPDWVWALLRRASARAENWTPLDAFIREVQASRPGDAWAWLVQAEQDSDDIVALAAAERALHLEPRLEAAWQARFVRLSKLSRLDEVQSLLPTLPWPELAPVHLRAWAPRCAWQRSERDSAVTQQRTLVAEAPHDEGLLRTLADWLDEMGRETDYLDVAQQLAAIAPLSPVSHLYLGHALLKCKRADDALAPLQRALQLEPSYSFAARQLCLAAEQAQKPDLAEPALQSLWPLERDVLTACQGIELAAQAKNKDRAFAWLDRLFTCEAFEIVRCQRAMEAMREAGWNAALKPLVLAQVARGGGPIGVTLDWLQQSEQRSYWYTLIRAVRLQRHAQGPHLLRAMVRWLKLGGHWVCLRWLMNRFESVLRADPLSWGDVSFALLDLNQPRAVVRWMHDWRLQEKAPVWALANLCAAHAYLGQWCAMAEVVEATLPRAPYQEDMRLWQLVVLAQRGQLDALQHGLDRLHEWQPDPWMRPAVKSLQAFGALTTQQAAGGTVAALRRCGAASFGMGYASIIHRLLLRTAFRVHTPLRQMWRWCVPW